MAALLLAGCASKWEYIRDVPGGEVTTMIEVETTPAGADVTLNGAPLSKSPFTVPVKYPYESRLFSRRNYWPYPHREEKEVPNYHRNKFTFRAFLVGHAMAQRELELNGEERVELKMRLFELP